MTAASATRWVEDGSADAILAFIRLEARGRQRMAPEIPHQGSFPGDPLAFDVWMPLPEEWTRFLIRVETVRLCLGGLGMREDLQKVLTFVAHSLTEMPERTPSLQGLAAHRDLLRPLSYRLLLNRAGRQRSLLAVS